MEDYKRLVDSARLANDGAVIYNGSIDHAKILVESLFESANKHVRILSGDLDPRVYGTTEVIEKARIFLANPRAKIQILVENLDDEFFRHHTLQRLLGEEVLKDQIEVKRTTVESPYRFDFHMMSADENSYRYEGDKTKPEAIAAFGDDGVCKNLVSVFDTLWDDTTNVSLFSDLETESNS